MPTHRTLIRGGYVITMDPALGDLPSADVLIDGERIAAIAPHLAVDDCALIDARRHIVLPGFVDTHRHTWQTQLRAICADWTLGDYVSRIRFGITPAYSADDVYVGNYVGGLEALHAGVTTLLDFSHCMNSPDHADAAVQGLRDAGVRALHCYGFFAAAPNNRAFADHAQRCADFGRIARTYGGSAGGLITIGAALTEVGLVGWPETTAEVAAARQARARMVLHTGCVWGSPFTGGVEEMHQRRLLGADQVHVHCNTLTDGEWQLLADAGALVSISPETELNMGMGRLALGKCRAVGIAPTLSCDIVSLNSGDLFAQMRLALAYQRFIDNDPINQSGAMPAQLTYTARDALAWATINGADACGLGAAVGSLRAGKQADIVLLGGNGFALRPPLQPHGAVVFQATAHDVRTVLVAGKVVKRDGALIGIDLPAALTRAERSAQAVLSRARQAGADVPYTEPTN